VAKIVKNIIVNKEMRDANLLLDSGVS